MVKLDQTPGDYTVRASATITPQFISGYSVMSYAPTANSAKQLPAPKNPSQDYGGHMLANYKSLDPLTLQPFPANPPPADATTTLILEMHRLTSLTWSMNQDPFGGMNNGYWGFSGC